MRASKHIANEAGQMMIEALLLTIVMGAIAFTLTQKLKESKLAPNLVTGPWEKVAGMAESGVWDPASTAQKKHPNNFSRFFTPRHE